MPVKKSAKKELRKNIKRRKRNLARKKKIKELIKKFHNFLKEKKIEKAQALFPKIQKELDKAGKVGIIKKNTVSRRKSKLARKLKRAKKESK